ncbi:UDP-N-acetylmuramate dehydrogenase [Treponema pallidum]|uniref:UDP-N-acetylmuramate dehydrogenase n=1 Tax=Treponema pallidum TaxID=160 RepID=UPI00244EFE01|nr:UDP-N-acetylmuramate dehydrogenase [Treponema pallidum]
MFAHRIRARRITRRNVPLAERCSFRIGGAAQFWAEPRSCTQLRALIEEAQRARIPLSLIGGGSNVLIADEGVPGLMLSLRRFRSLHTQTQRDGSVLVHAGAGLPVAALLDFCAHHALRGLETFAGLPGSVGGAAYMNARCYGRAIADCFHSARTLVLHPVRSRAKELPEVRKNAQDKRGECLGLDGGPFTCSSFQTVFARAGDWGYKRSPFQSPHGVELHAGRRLILSLCVRLTPGNPAQIRKHMQEKIADRISKGQFRFPSAGSAFKNNPAFGKPSGILIEEAGLRGTSCGAAQVAPWHGNLIINTGNATAHQVRTLLRVVRQRVFETHGVWLEREIIFSGESVRMTSSSRDS